MKTISTKAIIEGIRARKDGSLGLTVTTPELTVQEKAMFMELQNLNVNLLVEPESEGEVGEYKVSADLNEKKPSTRMRAVLFILWKQNPEGHDNDFDGYYRIKMEQLIDNLKSKIDAFRNTEY